MRRSSFSALAAPLALAPLFALSTASAQPPLAEYFGFDPQRIIIIDDGAGPLAIADFNADNRPDIAVANNRKSRIEIHSLRATPRSTAEIERDYEVNKLPPNQWYDRTEIIVRDRIAALAVTDFDADGYQDLVAISASPLGLVIFHQHAPGEFTEASRRDLVGLSTNSDALIVADLDGDGRDELVAIVSADLKLWDIDDTGRLSEPILLGSGEGLRQLLTGDFDADGQLDLLAVAPGSETPLQLWLHNGGSIGSLPTLAVRFDVPNILDADVISTGPGSPDQIAVIENGTRRHIVYELTETQAGESRVARLITLPANSSNTRPIAIADLDADGYQDIISLSIDANETTILWQLPDAGLSMYTSHPTFKSPSAVAVGRWAGRDDPAVFVLSEAESTVGVSWLDESTGSLSFPDPIALTTAGGTPVAMQTVNIDGDSVLMVIVKKRRDYVLEAHRWTPEGDNPATIELDGVTKAPQSILAFDADRDATTDLLLLTPNEPMLMVLGESEDSLWSPSEVLDKDAMGQFGLVQAAGPANTAIRDLDADNLPELLIADANFVRACVYSEDLGWRVTEQFNLDPEATIASITLDGDRLLVADTAQDRIVILEREDNAWRQTTQIKVQGVAVGPMHAARFTGDQTPSALIIDGADLALVTLAGPARTLSPTSVYRPDAENRYEHEITAADINSDGYTDLITLDAREQICSILSIAASARIVPATEFKVFETRLFSRGESLEFEPSLAIATDLTGDAKHDLLLLVHDRIIIYPQASGR